MRPTSSRTCCWHETSCARAYPEQQPVAARASILKQTSLQCCDHVLIPCHSTLSIIYTAKISCSTVPMDASTPAWRCTPRIRCPSILDFYLNAFCFCCFSMKQDTVDQHCRFDESFCHLFCFSSGRFLLLLFHHETMLGLNTDTYI